METEIFGVVCTQGHLTLMMLCFVLGLALG